MATRIQVTLGNGQVVYYDSSGQAWTAPTGGTQVSNQTVSQSTATAPTKTTTQPQNYTSPAPSSSESQPKGSTSVSTGSTLQSGYQIKVQDGSFQDIYTYIGNNQWNRTDTLGRAYPNVTTAQLPGSVSSQLPSGALAQHQTSTTQQTGSIQYNPAWAARGITQDMWNSLNAAQQATLGATIEAGNSIVSNTGHSVTMQDALNAAQNDPNIKAKYADAFKIDTQNFVQNLQQIQKAVQVNSEQQKQQFEQERLALASQYAAAGEAYSGFRGRAQQQLGQTEQGIVTSSLSQLQKQLQDATTAFEQKYGTQMTTPATATFLNPSLAADVTLSGQTTTPNITPTTETGQLVGGITGSEPVQKSQDIASLAAQNYSLSATPSVIPA